MTIISSNKRHILLFMVRIDPFARDKRRTLTDDYTVSHEVLT